MSGWVDSGQSMLRPVRTAMSLVFHRTRVHIWCPLGASDEDVGARQRSRGTKVHAGLRMLRGDGAVRGDLPAGYEFTALPSSTAPVSLSGFGQVWTADPSHCGGLADPIGDGVVHGWSASGPGGIVHAVVADGVPGVDQTLREACDTWQLSAGHTGGVVTLVEAPAIDGAVTLGMAIDATTTVEGGIETHSHAQTFVAYLRDHAAWVTVVTDPGSAGPSLGADRASELLVDTVAAIRG